MIKYPEMIVEKKNSNPNSWGLRPPTRPGEEGFEEQLNDFLVLVQGAKSKEAYSEEVLYVLDKWNPRKKKYNKFQNYFAEFGFNSWRELVDFVRDDECMELFMRVAKWLKGRGCKFKRDRDFIDGGGFGIYRRYEDRATRVLKKAFDVKYKFEEERPVFYLNDRLGVDSSSILVYLHPGHWRYPAGHGAKFWEIVDMCNDTWDLKDREWLYEREAVFMICYGASMARTGGGVHFVEDNLASGYLAGIKELSHYGVKE